MKCRLLITVGLFVLLLVSGRVSMAAPLGPGFTYQGQLQVDGGPAAGPANLRFSLWDAAMDGNQIGASQLVADIPVTNGLFVVTLNEANQFGAEAFNGEERWLQLEDCPDGACAAPEVFLPRQPITGVPYAHHALLAPWYGLIDIPEGFADGVDNSADSLWQSNGSSIGYTGGLVGIGTTAPDTKFQVNDGRIRIRETATLERWDLFYDPPSQKFYLQENAAYNHLVFTKGPDARVGVGTDSPVSKLDIAGQDALGMVGYQPFLTFKDTNASNARGRIQSANGDLNFYSEIGLITGIPPLQVLNNNLVTVNSPNTLICYSGVQGINTNTPGVRGQSQTGSGVHGESISGTGISGESSAEFGSAAAVRGENISPSGIAILGIGTANNYAGYFDGYVGVNGNLAASGTISGSNTKMTIDHPLDPANEFLSLSAVESPEMKTVYDGNVVTDSKGYAEVSLPDWFEALNKDFRYQLTVIGQFAQAIIEKKIENNRFTIRTDKPDIEVSWQVTGIRQDAWAQAHPIEVEKVKSEKDRGKYLTPEVFGQPKEKAIGYRPELEGLAKGK